MAKGKHSPALFEVVHGKKHVDKVAREGALRTPNWWFKGRQRVAEAGLQPPAPAPAFDPREFEDDDTPEPPPASSSDDPTANASALTLRAREARAAAYQPTQTLDAEVVPEPTRHDEPESDALVIPPALSAPSRGRRSPVQFALDRDRHEMYVRVRYTTAIVAGFTLIVLLALSYITGRNVGRGPSSATASPSAEEIAAGPVEAGVFDLASRNAGPSAATLNTATPAAGVVPGGGFGAQRPPASRPTPVTTTPLVVAPPPRPAGPAVEPNPVPPKNVRRTVNLQYVIVQGYPPEEKQMAQDACEYLNAANIPCTVETGVEGWNTRWFYVVGAQPFERASGPEYSNYIEAIEKVNDKFAGKSRFKRFAPQATRWRGTRAGG